MTAIPTIRIALPAWFKRKTERSAPIHDYRDDDLRREYLTRLIASEACTGEYGMQALMGLFPKDF